MFFIWRLSDRWKYDKVLTKYLKKICYIKLDFKFCNYIVMAWKIIVDEMYEICNGCERNKFRETTNKCGTCIYNVFRSKLEAEQRNQKEYEEKRKNDKA